jgi:hypothetical protein
VLAEDPRVTEHLSRGELARVFDLMSYQGAAQIFIDRISTNSKRGYWRG